MPDKPSVFLETKTMDSSENTSHFYIFISVLSKRGSESFENMSSVLCESVFLTYVFWKNENQKQKMQTIFSRKCKKTEPNV